MASFTDLTDIVPPASMFALKAIQPTASSYLVYREVSSTPTNTNGPGAIADNDKPRISHRSILDVTTVQISCFALDYLEVENIAVEVRRALDRENGLVPTPYDTDIYLDSCVYDSCVDDYDEKFGDQGIYIKHLDFPLRINRLDIN